MTLYFLGVLGALAVNRFLQWSHRMTLLKEGLLNRKGRKGRKDLAILVDLENT